MIKLLNLISIGLSITFIIGGCENKDSDTSDKGTQQKVNISFNSASYIEDTNAPLQSSNRSSKKMSSINYTKISDEFFKDSLKKVSRGHLLNRYTPTQFILMIDYMTLNNESISSTLNSDGTSTKIGRGLSNNSEKIIDIDDFSLPKHYNMMHADRIIRDFGVKSSSFKNFLIEILPAANPVTNDEAYLYSIVVIDLGEKYKNITFQNETTNRPAIVTKGTEHVFSFADIQPLYHIFFGSLILSSEVSKPYILTGGVGGIILPTTELDFSNYENPTLNLSWDMDNLIEVYDNETPDDLTDDLVTFNLSNPFPINVKVVEQPSLGESLFATISNPTIDNTNPLEIIKDTVKVVITDDDDLNNKGTVRFSSNSYNVNEADKSIQLQVIREAGKSSSITVSYQLSNISNTAGPNDYNLTKGSLTWLDGDMDPKYIEIPISDDSVNETMEYFDVELTSTDSSNISGWAKTRINIFDNNNTDTISGILFSSNYFYGLESNHDLEVTLTRIGNPKGTITIDLDTKSGLATKGIDFTSNLKTITWNDHNMTSKVYSINVIDDHTVEPFANNSNDHTSPHEVFMLYTSKDYERGTTARATVIQWVNPIDEDFDHIIITRKENSAPTNKNDGEQVYNSYIPIYRDDTGISGTNYYYLVQAVDKVGNASTGKIVHQVQN